MCNVLKECEMC